MAVAIKADGWTAEFLVHKCQRAAKLVEEIMLETRAYALLVGQGTNGMSFQLDRRGFDRLFPGMPATIIPYGSIPNQVKKAVRLVEDVEFFCLYQETPEEQMARLLDLVAPDKRAEVVGSLMARVGGKE